MWRVHILRCFRALGLLFAFAAAVFVLSATAQDSQSCPQPQAEQAPQTPDASVAAAARKTKAQKGIRTTKVFTDEDVDAASGPLPRLRLDGPANSEEVLDALYAYKSTHTPEQTEQVIHDWYDRYDEMLMAAINQNRNMMTIRNVNASNAYDLCQESDNPGSCQYSQRTSGQSMRSDSDVMMKNTNLQQRIQQEFTRINMGLFQGNLHYGWFKLRSFDGSELPSFPTLAKSR